jgi:hypothetical protein
MKHIESIHQVFFWTNTSLRKCSKLDIPGQNGPPIPGESEPVIPGESGPLKRCF